MLKRILSRDISSRAIRALDPTAQPATPPEAAPKPTTSAANPEPPKRKPRSMRDSDIKDEHGRSAEEIAAEAAKEFDIDAVVRKAGMTPAAAAQPVAPAVPVSAAASVAPAPVAAPAPQPVAQAAPAAPPAPTFAPATANRVEIKSGHIFQLGASTQDIQRTRAARNAYWDAVGQSDPELLGYPVSPQVMGQPAWPTQHQNFRLVRTEGSVIIASEGLSDPFGPFTAKSGVNGFGLEVFVELVGWQAQTASDIRKSWAFKAVEYVARVAAYAETLNDAIAGHETISLDLPMTCVPDGWVVPGVADPAGALLNVAQPPGRSAMTGMPLSPVAVVPVTPIYPEELETCVLEGASERRALANDLLTSGSGHRMNTTRKSLR
jgi:hypothetical protein